MKQHVADNLNESRQRTSLHTGFKLLLNQPCYIITVFHILAKFGFCMCYYFNILAKFGLLEKDQVKLLEQVQEKWQNVFCFNWILEDSLNDTELSSQNLIQTFPRYFISAEFVITVLFKCKLTVSQSSILETQFSTLENFEDRGLSRVSRRSRPFENLSSRVSRLSSGKNKGLFAQLTFDTSEYFFTGRSILISGP